MARRKVPDPIVHVKFFTPYSNWTWYVTEGEAEEDDFRFFGYVCGMEEEWGYFVLSELESARGPLGLPIERHLHFTPGPFSVGMATESRNRAEYLPRGRSLPAPYLLLVAPRPSWSALWS